MVGLLFSSWVLQICLNNFGFKYSSALFWTETFAALSGGTRWIWSRGPSAAWQAKTYLHIQPEVWLEEKQSVTDGLRLRQWWWWQQFTTSESSLTLDIYFVCFKKTPSQPSKDMFSSFLCRWIGALSLQLGVSSRLKWMRETTNHLCRFENSFWSHCWHVKLIFKLNTGST